MAGGQCIALRQVGTLYFLHSDHLGSVTLTTDAGGNRVGELRYTPYGVLRHQWGNTPTDRRYTDQRWDDALALYDYRARYYDPALGRFVQPDTVVPNPADPQSLNRFTYVRNNPLRFTDPTGHCVPGVNCPILDTLLPVPSDTYRAWLAQWQANGAYWIFTRLPTSRKTIRFTQGFGNTKFAYNHGGEYYSRLGYIHSGIDLAMAAGETVYAICDGVVTGYNQYVKNEQSVVVQYKGYIIVYIHVVIDPALAKKLDQGIKVPITAGTAIGTIQDKGANSHLHLEVRSAENEDIFYNPLYFFDPRVLDDITGLEDQYVNLSGEVDTSYNVWSMGWYNRGEWNEKTETYGNFWKGTVTVFWGRWWSVPRPVPVVVTEGGWQ